MLRADVKAAKRYAFRQRAVKVARNLLLMAATPCAGTEDEHQLLLTLLDPVRFEGEYRPGVCRSPRGVRAPARVGAPRSHREGELTT